MFKTINFCKLYFDRHFQKPGTPFTMAEISDWAKRPFAGENIFVVGESYNPSRGWCEGALLSSKNALKEGWGIQMDEKLAARNVEMKKDIRQLVRSEGMARP
jgi:hypothetical protein